eukprot:Gregarina_sp_Poly_1__5688@NODE_29_length_19459_cov_103_994070_g26_i0_p2_GENE_NODE_29_length_19459_cov_103_994070_g26_i0NODE_29_length_19459_cov_103_994070_g26_i0_p2_ORF_typecomplete_len898_score105_19_NODE_29_length_19459_cov_103_994070_g26_i01403916732
MNDGISSSPIGTLSRSGTYEPFNDDEDEVKTIASESQVPADGVSISIPSMDMPDVLKVTIRGQADRKDESDISHNTEYSLSSHFAEDKLQFDKQFSDRLALYAKRLTSARSPGPAHSPPVPAQSAPSLVKNFKKTNSALSAYGFTDNLPTTATQSVVLTPRTPNMQPRRSFGTVPEFHPIDNIATTSSPPKLRFAIPPKVGFESQTSNARGSRHSSIEASRSYLSDLDHLNDLSSTRRRQVASTLLPQTTAKPPVRRLNMSGLLESTRNAWTYGSTFMGFGTEDAPKSNNKESLSAAGYRRSFVPSDPGIAVTAADHTPPWKFLFLTLLWSLCSLKLLMRVVERVVIDDAILLPQYANVNLNLRDCTVAFHHAKPNEDSKIILRGWMHQMEWFQFPKSLLRKVRPSHQTDEATNSIDIFLQRRYPSYFFQCSVSFNLQPEYVFERVQMQFQLADEYSLVVSDPYLSLRVRSKFMADFVNAEARLPRLFTNSLTLSIRDGSLDFGHSLDSSQSRNSTSSLKVIAGTAAVTMKTDYPVDMVLPVEDVPRVLVQTDGSIDASYEKDSSYDDIRLTVIPKGSQQEEFVSVTPYLSGTPLYIKSCRSIFNSDFDRDTKFQTWGGSLQASAPRLTEISLSRITEIPAWVQESPDAPWMIYAKMLGPELPEGRWKFVSTGALLGHNIDIILLAAGILDPRTAYMRLHIYGMYCPVKHEAREALSTLRRSSAETPNDSPRQLLAYEEDSKNRQCMKPEVPFRRLWAWRDFGPLREIGSYLGESYYGMEKCRNMLLESQFRVFWKTFQDVRAPSVLPLWCDGYDANADETRFDLSNDTLMTQLVDVSLTWRFTLAIMLNLIIACSGGFWVARSTVRQVGESFYDGYMLDEAVNVAASWRLDNAVSS